MTRVAPITFIRLADGTLLQLHPDGVFQPIASTTDRAALASLTDAQIEDMAAADPDHPGLDDDFWAGANTASPAKEAISIKLDSDVLR